MSYQETYAKKKGSVEDCLAQIRSNDVVVLAGDGNCPLAICKRLHEIAPNVTGVRVFKDHTNNFDWPTKEGMGEHIFTTGFFYGKDLRDGLPLGNTSFFPSDICGYARFINTNHPSVFIGAVTPMDEKGNFQLSLCDMWEEETLDNVRRHGGRIILEVNSNIPRVNGAAEVNVEDVTVLVESDEPITKIPATQPSPEEVEVARNVRSLIHDGDCVQFGIGALPNAIADFCMDLNDLGMHTEMFTTAMAKMVREGVITGKKKNFNPGVHLFTFVGGEESLFETLRGDYNFKIVPASYGCDPAVIGQNDNMVSINTCIEMDLMGQVASEAIGTRQFSGSGGAFCYAYGAMRSKGGRGIMAFSSRTAKGYSKIKHVLDPGATVTVPRNYVDHVVTEYGIARLVGKTLKERAAALIGIAHPDFRAELTKEAKKLMWL